MNYHITLHNVDSPDDIFYRSADPVYNLQPFVTEEAANVHGKEVISRVAERTKRPVEQYIITLIPVTEQ